MDPDMTQSHSVFTLSQHSLVFHQKNLHQQLHKISKKKKKLHLSSEKQQREAAEQQEQQDQSEEKAKKPKIYTVENEPEETR